MPAITPQLSVLDTPARSIVGESIKIGFLGPPRRGKSLKAAVMCYEAWLQGAKVFHLGNLSFGEVLDLDWLADQDPDTLRNCIVYLDEIRSVLPSARAGSTFSLLVANNIIQAGHQGVSLIWTTITDRGLNRTIGELTDLVYWVEGRQRPWTSHEGQTCEQAEFSSKKGKHVHCPAWDPASPFQGDHASPPAPFRPCTDFDHQRTVVFDIVAQLSSPLPTGWRLTGRQLPCAQRYYALFSTTHKVDASGPMLLTSDELRAREQLERFRMVRAVCESMNAERVSLAGVMDAVEVAHGVQLSPSEAGKHLTDLGIGRGRRGAGANLYAIGLWNKREQSAG